MISRRNILGLAAVLVTGGVSTLQAAETTAFTAAKFEAAQRAGKPILVDIWASWCPTCKAQTPVIEGLMKTPKFKDMVVLRVDFDGQKDIVRAMGAQRQSTLIVFNGNKEMGRSAGETDPAAIEGLLASAI